MTDIELVMLSIGVTFFGILLVFASKPHWKAVILISAVTINSILTTIPAIKALMGNPLTMYINWASFLQNIPVRIDALSAWFILIINLTCINGAIYGVEYMKPYRNQKANISLHWILFILFHSSMVWVCMVQHSIAFLVAWELMSLSSFLLVIFEHHNKKTLKMGIDYLVQMHIGILFLTSAFIWVYFSEGSFDFSAIGKFFSSNADIWLFFLFFVGFGIKAGFIPLHSWLPHAHPAAPSNISAVMSGVIVKLGIYGILRITFMLKRDYFILGESILTISILTGLYGILNAAVHRDFKKMLAYCTIENIGIIGTGIGIGLMGMGNGDIILMVLGFGGALLHTLNHSLFKSLLFFSSGSVYQQTHTRDMEKLGGLATKMPQTRLLFLIGAIAICGFPPFNGFISEFLLYSGYIEGVKTLDVSHSILMITSIACLAIIGGISILTFTKSFGTIFLGHQRTHLASEPREVSFKMRLPQYLIIFVMLSIGIFPQYYFSVLVKIITSLFLSGNFNPAPAINRISLVMSSIGKCTLVFVGCIILVNLLRKYFSKQHLTTVNATWGCGFVAPNTKMQYTGKSFSKQLGKLLNFIVIEKKKYKEISGNEIFPEERKHSSHYIDFFETKIINRFVDKMVYAANYFQFIQNGKIQMYILYGIFFIMLVFFGTLFNVI